MNALQAYGFRAAQDRMEEAARLLNALEARAPRGPQINFARLVLSMSAPDRSMHGEDREVLEEASRQAKIPFDAHRPLIPFSAFRDLTKATAGAGGYLVSAEVAEAVDILRPWSVTARAGVMVETGLVGDLAIPRVTAKTTPEWLADEASEATPSQPTLAQIVLTPKLATSQVTFSRQLAKQANAEAFVRRELMRTVGTAVDVAVLNGSGTNGQPTGLLVAAGVQTQSGASLNHAGTTAMKQKCASANVNDQRIVFLSTPAIRELLENRLRTGNGSRYVWDDEKVADRPAFVSTDVPAATMVAGDFGNIYVGIWGEAFVLEINPYDPAGFKKGTIAARIILSCDVAVLHASGFVKAGTIT
jgi:HK97 family phage major capsid protein